MRHLVVLSILLAPALAFAQPALTATTEPSDADTGNYLQLGAVVGVLRSNSANTGAFYGAIPLEGGYHLHDSSLWLHGQVALGTLAGIDEPAFDSSYFEARGGIEARRCVLAGKACVVGGVDLGVRREYLMSYDHIDATNVVIVPRAGLDVGSDHFRLRPSLELALGTDGFGVGLSLAAAYVW